MKKYLLSVFIAMAFLHGDAQDINFSQFSSLPLLRNPALAGLFKGDIHVMLADRSQWGSVTVPYNTQALGAEIRLPVSPLNYLTLGLQITNDKAGDSKMSKTQVLPVITFNKCLSEERNTYLSIGFSGGMVQQRFDASELKFDDQFINGAYSAANPTRQTFNNANLIYWDLNTGISFSTELDNGTQLYAGAAYFHLTKPRVAFDADNDIRLNNKTVFNAGAKIPVTGRNNIEVYADIFYQGGNRQWQGGFLYRHDLRETTSDEETISFSTGSYFRGRDAIIPVVKMDYYKVSLGISYDVNMSKLKPASQLRGAYEITLSYRSFLKSFDTEINRTRCPVKF